MGVVRVTYSLLAYDSSRKKLGIGVVSGSIAVGSRVPWGRGGLAVVATQGYTNPLLALYIIDNLEKGLDAKNALDNALALDPNPEYRQVAVLTIKGDKAVYTGLNTPSEKECIVGENYIGIGNLLSSREVIKNLIEGFKETKGSLEEKILNGLLAASRAGGDARGDTSSAILIFGEHPEFKGYDKLLDLRIDYSSNPVNDLINLYNLYRKYY